jgi:hypothetical protein
MEWTPGGELMMHRMPGISFEEKKRGPVSVCRPHGNQKKQQDN